MNIKKIISKLPAELAQYKHEGVISKYIKEFNVSRRKALSHFRQLKEFLFLSSIVKKPCVPTPEVDASWHTFILFTKEYENFCRRFFGKFIHHTPDEKMTLIFIL